MFRQKPVVQRLSGAGGAWMAVASRTEPDEGLRLLLFAGATLRLGCDQALKPIGE
jgi:hypothetical protein